MAKSRETALYYDPEGGERAQQVKTVLVCMGARIRNIAAADFAQTVGFALGRAGFAQCADIVEAPEQPMLVLDGFTSKRLDVLLRELRQHGVSVQGDRDRAQSPVDAACTVRRAGARA